LKNLKKKKKKKKKKEEEEEEGENKLRLSVYMGIYLNKWSGELQLEIKEGCVHGTWMPPLLTNSFYGV
jgi:hypothetical protein